MTNACRFYSKGAVRIATCFLSNVVDEVESIPIEIPSDIASHISKPEVLRVVDEVMGKGTSSIIAAPTVNIGTIKGGVKVNMIPDTCVFELDIRLPIGLTAETVMGVIESIVQRYNAQDATIEIRKQEAASNPSSFSPISHPMVRYLMDNAKVIAPDSHPIAIPSMGATDCKHYRYAGVPAYVYGCSPYSSKSTPP